MTVVTTDTPVEPTTNFGSHTLSVQTKNEPGVLMRICQVFARRAFNIDSLVVAESRDRRFARMTIDISGDPKGLEQIIKQVNKLIDVIHCYEHTTHDAVAKEMIMVKIEVAQDNRTEAINIIEHFGGKTVDLAPKSMIALIGGNTEKIDAALEMLNQYEIIETVRTGKIVMARGEGITS